MTITFSLACETKAGYLRYEHQGRSIYLPKTIAAAEPPATITITADGLAEPRAAKEQDPVALQAKADKAAERARKTAEQAARLAEQVATLKAAQPASQPPATAEKPTATRRNKKAAA